MSENIDKPLEISLEDEKKYDEETLTPSKRAGLQIYQFTNVLKGGLVDIIGRKIHDIKTCFVPPDHPERGLFDMGWRILILFNEEEGVLVNPTYAYTVAFMSAEAEDVRFQRILDEINKSYSEGNILVLPVPEAVEEPDGGENVE